ncbi:MAG: ABC-2 family transporter protein [Bdellovibrionales bacterium]|nr:ABC-2 family transporter protein [Bdellovibrionales bacterium]
MLRLFKIYTLYFAQSLKTRLAYAVDFLALMFASMIITASGILFVVFLIDGKNVTSIGSWSRDEILFIYGISTIATALFSFVSSNLYQFGERWIIQGEFDRVLVRPLNSLCQVLFESFNLESIGSLVVGFGIVFFSAGRLDISFSLLDYIWLILSTISGGVIITSVFVIVTSFSFHFEDRVGLSPPVFNMMMFSRYPLPIFNKGVQFLLMWILPFAFAGFFPSTHFLNRNGFELYCYATPVMAVILTFIANLFWNFGVSRYSSVGN